MRVLLLSSLLAGVVWLTTASATEEQEVLMDEVLVEGEFDAPLQLQREPVVTEFIRELQLRDDATRARELQEANKSAVARLLELTRYIPIPLGSSENKLDPFFLQNYMRADLNPGRENPLLDR